MIEYIDISKKYKEKLVLEDFNLKIKDGEFITILGRSGTGKTTVVKMINGLVKPDKGSVLIDGKNIENENLIALRRKIGYSIQGNILFPHMSVFENIAYVLRLENRNEEEIKKVVKEKLEMVQLPLDIQNRYPDELSGGQQQRVGIARALAASPKIVIMDEPFGAVDVITRDQLQHELKELHKKTKITVVFITHDVIEALKLGDRVLILDQGKIQQLGTPKEIVNNPANDFVKKLINSFKFSYF